MARLRKLLPVVSIVLLASCSTTVERGFESGTFRGWYREFPDRRSATIVGSPVRRGSYAARFEVAADDETITGGLRSEVSELFYKAPYDTDMWYRFSTYIPDDWPDSDARCVIAQWHAWPDLLRGEAWRSPVIAVEYRSESFLIRICHNDERVQHDNARTSNNKTILYNSDARSQKGVWHDFVVHAVFSPAGDGTLRVWIDGEPVVEYLGALGYNDRRGPWFKMGIYRDPTPEPFVLYHDDYRRGRTAADIGFRFGE